MEEAIAIADKTAALAADPEGVVAGDFKTEDVVVGKSGRILAVVKDESGAIETKQTARGPDPEITVARLRERLHHLLRKAIVHTPGAFRKRDGRMFDRSCNGPSSEAQECHGDRDSASRRTPADSHMHREAE